MTVCGECINYSHSGKCILNGKKMTSGLIADGCSLYNKQLHSCNDCKFYKQSACSNKKVISVMIKNKFCGKWEPSKKRVGD